MPNCTTLLQPSLEFLEHTYALYAFYLLLKAGSVFRSRMLDIGYFQV